MDKILASTNVEKKRKAIDLPKDVVTGFGCTSSQNGHIY